MKPRIPGLRLSSLPGAEIFPLAVPGESRVCNPSIAISDRGDFFCIIRAVNYDLDSYGRVMIPPPEGFQSSNWFAELDSDLAITRIDQIDDSAVGIDRQRWNRLEDCRLFRWKGDWWFTATWVLQDRPFACQIALCRLDGNKVAEWHLLPSPVNALLEKNWMPCIDGDRLRWIYWIDPMAVLTCDGHDLRCEHLRRYGRLEGWAGSSSLVRYRGNWLAVVHLKRNWRHTSSFVHRLVELNDDFRLLRMSRIFTFGGNDVEYCAGLCVTESHAILSYGVQDLEAHLMRLELSELDVILKPLRVPRWLSILVADMWRATRPWIRQPRRTWLAVIRSRGLGILSLFGLGDATISTAQYINLAM